MTTVEIFVRHFLGIYFLLIGLHYTSRGIALSDRTGIVHFSYGRALSRTWWYRHIFNLFRASILLVCLARLVWPIDPYLGLFESLYRAPVLIVGVLLMLLSYCIIDYVHSYMHTDWRSGLDTWQGQPLIRKGPFARSRNPLFVGILVGQLGFFLALPSLFSLVCLLVGAVVIVLQAREEEAALSRHFGAEYQAYSRQVRRWL